MRQLPAGVRIFIICTILAGASLAFLAAARLAMLAPSVDPSQWLSAACLIAIVALLSRFRVPLPTGSGAITVSTIGHVLSLIVLPLPLALMVSGAGFLAAEIYGRARLIKAAFNASTIMVTVGVTGGVLAPFGGSGVLFDPLLARPLTLLAVCLICGVYYTVNVSIFTVFQALLNERGAAYTFRVNHRSAMVPELLAIIVGVIGALLWRMYVPLAILTLVPAGLAHFAFQSIRRLQSETVHAVTALANSIDVRDPYTAEHSVRVATLARRLALALRLDDDKVDQIVLAASVHDIGKMSVPVEVLDKPGALSPDERIVIQQHPVTGAEVLKHYKGFGPMLPLVLHHHERWDGQGYPRGLTGPTIPLGARIIALADTFDAMTSDRPYRQGMCPLEALRRIAGAAGTQFDPILAASFVDLLEDDYPPQTPEDSDRIVVFPPINTPRRAVPSTDGSSARSSP